jgi:hypothetical protein
MGVLASDPLLKGPLRGMPKRSGATIRGPIRPFPWERMPPARSEFAWVGSDRVTPISGATLHSSQLRPLVFRYVAVNPDARF